MVSSRTWLAAFILTGVASVAILVVNGAGPERIWTGAAIVAAHTIVFLALRRRAREGDAAAIAQTAATVLATGSLTAVSPELAFSQFLAYPLVWVLARSARAGLVASGALALAVAVGFWFAFGERVEALPQIAAIQALSFAFSAIMGLWISRIADLGAEKSRLLDELTSAQDELAALHRDAGAAEERARMSREVHDTVAQSLTGLVLLAQRARRELSAGELDDAALELIESGARDALAETRALVAVSAPVELARGGLADALGRLAERFERETRIRVTSSVAPGAPLDRDAEVVLLRCAQEGLANVRKHSGATSARVELVAADGAVRLRVTDDGRGFPSGEGDGDGADAGFGIRGLRERLALAGGMLEVDGTPGATSLTATLPVGAAPGTVPADGTRADGASA